MKMPRWFSAFNLPTDVRTRNFVNVQIDAVGVGLANAAAPFLPVFLTRSGATSLQVGLLTTMPAITGLLLSLPLGRMLQQQAKIVPWYSSARVSVIMTYAITGLVVFFVPQAALVPVILGVWALATIPQNILTITFSVVMNAVAGKEGRFELVSRRWSILGFTSAATVFLIGQVLDNYRFPLNYQMAFIGLSAGGLISYFVSRRIEIPDSAASMLSIRLPFKQEIQKYFGLVKQERPFLSFVLKRFVYMTGVNLALPLFPIYFVREIQASDGWIAAINTAQTAILILGYFFWTRQSRRRGSRNVLLWTTFCLAFYPILTAVTHDVRLIVVYAGLSGIFQAGLNLVFFDELMRTVPPDLSATFVSIAQSFEYLAAVLAPLLASFLADAFGLSAALIAAGLFRLAGFSLFRLEKSRPAAVGY